MRRAITFAIGASLLYAVAIPAYATAITVADANDGDKSSDPALNGQPIAGCGFLESFDIVPPPLLPPHWTAINAIDPDSISCGRLLIPETQVRQPNPCQMPRGLTIQMRSAINTSTPPRYRSIPTQV